MDVSHHDDVTDYHLPEGETTTACSKTITYQLDGTVGLTADLALMAQAAALAREVGSRACVAPPHASAADILVLEPLQTREAGITHHID